MLDVEDYSQWLRNQPIEESTRRNQVSRVRRLERIFGDLDQAHAADALAGVIAALEYSPGDAARRKPLPPKLRWSGDIVSVMQTLRHAANTYRRYLDERRAQHLPSARPSARRTRFEPLRPPLPAPTRTLAPTGFWTFQANTATWDIDAWAAQGETALAYRVSKDDVALMQVGDLGLIRRVASGRHKAAIVAIVEVVQPVAWRADPDPRFYRDKAQAAAKDWRVELAVRAIAEEPLLVARLVGDAALDRVRRGWQRTTTPIPREAFERVAALFGLTAAMLEDQRAARTFDTLVRPPTIYFNIGWMEHYAGIADEDQTIGAHGFLAKHPHGAESYNFLETPDGMVRGYRPPGDREETNINRMGATSRQEAVEGALVIWLAKEPASGRTLIVGWYSNATVFRSARDAGITLYGERIHYSVEARAKDATLLPPVARTFEVRSSRLVPGAGFGQKPTWYGAEAVDARVWDYVRSRRKIRPTAKPSAGKGPPRNVDPELRRKVEKAAVDHAIAYYKAEFGDACPVISVETAAKGWDLEVYNGADPLLVEVKGLLNTPLVCELTPNEYEKMMLDANYSRYVVYVVNNALAEYPAMPIASIFEHAGDRVWRTADGRELVITAKTGAVLSCG
ncbi:MAG TPA: EVE domain-containing protein [Allosphingosinicella sp.]|nr:EVE domain-containing protein [Allosphingosinicella sp.]